MGGGHPLARFEASDGVLHAVAWLLLVENLHASISVYVNHELGLIHFSEVIGLESSFSNGSRLVELGAR